MRVDALDVRALLREHNRRSECGASPSADEKDFHQLIERYKRVCGRPFLTWSEVLALALAMGFRRVAPPAPIAQGADASPIDRMGGRRRERMRQLAEEGKCPRCRQGAAPAAPA